MTAAPCSPARLSVLVFAGSAAARRRLVEAVVRSPTVLWWDCVARADEVVPSYLRRPADVVLVGTQRAMSTGVEAASQLTRAVPGARVLLVGPGDDQPLVAATIATGAHGYLRWEALGSPVLTVLAEALANVGPRGVGLLAARRRQQQQQQVLAAPAVAPGAVLDGGLAKRELQVLLKLGVDSRSAAVLAGFRLGLLS